MLGGEFSTFGLNVSLEYWFSFLISGTRSWHLQCLMMRKGWIQWSRFSLKSQNALSIIMDPLELFKSNLIHIVRVSLSRCVGLMVYVFYQSTWLMTRSTSPSGSGSSSSSSCPCCTWSGGYNIFLSHHLYHLLPQAVHPVQPRSTHGLLEIHCSKPLPKNLSIPEDCAGVRRLADLRHDVPAPGYQALLRHPTGNKECELHAQKKHLHHYWHYPRQWYGRWDGWKRTNESHSNHYPHAA